MKKKNPPTQFHQPTGQSRLLLQQQHGCDGANAQQPSAPPPPAAAAPTAIAPDKEKVRQVAAVAESLVTEFEVNGLKVLVKRRAGSQTVSAGLFLRGGARNVNERNAGVESLMWDVATEAGTNFPREMLRKELARMGSGIGSGVNYDYSALTLATTRPNFDRSWDIFTDVALHPAFTLEDFKRVQNRSVISRRDDTDTPDSYLQLLQARVAYAGHPYLNDPDGTADTLSRLTIDDVRRFHKEMLQTTRLLLVVVGDLDPATVRRRVADSFGKLPRGDYRPQPVAQLAFNNATVDITQRALPTNYVQAVFAAPSLTSDDIYPMRVASSLLNDRVLVEVRFRRNLSYAPSAFLRDQGANVGGIYVTAVDANQAISVMLHEISVLQRERVDAQDISSEVNGYLTKYYMGQETNAAQAGELGLYELIGGGWRNSLDILARVRAVTPADVQRVAQKYMHNLRFVVIGDPAQVDKTLFTTQTGDE